MDFHEDLKRPASASSFRMTPTHHEIPTVTPSGKKGSAAMRTSVTVAYLINNAPILPNREICIIDTHPGLLDAVSLTDLLSLATSTYQLLQGNFTAAGAAILPLLRPDSANSALSSPCLGK
jgi:hypothetical protein